MKINRTGTLVPVRNTANFGSQAIFSPNPRAPGKAEALPGARGKKGWARLNRPAKYSGQPLKRPLGALMYSAQPLKPSPEKLWPGMESGRSVSYDAARKVARPILWKSALKPQKHVLLPFLGRLAPFDIILRSGSDHKTGKTSQPPTTIGCKKTTWMRERWKSPLLFTKIRIPNLQE